jgi:hypothetical protein
MRRLNLERVEKQLGSNHPRMFVAHLNTARTLYEMDDLELAFHHAAQARRLADSLHESARANRRVLEAILLIRLGRAEEARPHYGGIVDTYREELGEDSPRIRRDTHV